MKRVLIVEKDVFTAEMIAEALQILHYRPTIHHSSDVLAIQLVDIEPEIVIINRPLLLKHRHLFVESSNPSEKLVKAAIVITSNAFLTSSRVAELGGDAYLQKPFTLEGLASVLDTVQTLA
ncbi:response regulator transcription factor [Pedobacter sp. SYSU D00535]|uniref:response regulator transcription factor n=1 Tax=Pedobacter sp. SYSU D00535 TaxID=2810308 RepID=UPI001A9735B8|nr:response regulator transcription factor [Pedobacter sp. SYSU D00535]